MKILKDITLLAVLISLFLGIVASDETDSSQVQAADNAPAVQADSAPAVEESSEAENTIQGDTAPDENIEESLETSLDQEENVDYYDDNWTDTLMNPIRNVGQTISDTVQGAANMINAGADQVNKFWGDDEDEDYDDDYYDNYDRDQDQVNAWWDAQQEVEYSSYAGDDDDKKESTDKKEDTETEDEKVFDDEEEMFDDDEYDYDDLYQAIKYPKPSESKVEPSQIHHPKDNKVQLSRMKSRLDMPYGVDDYFDFVVVAMCVVLLFIMLLAGVSRFNNQKYLRKTYGRKSPERHPLIA